MDHTIPVHLHCGVPYRCLVLLSDPDQQPVGFAFFILVVFAGGHSRLVRCKLLCLALGGHQIMGAVVSVGLSVLL